RALMARENNAETGEENQTDSAEAETESLCAGNTKEEKSERALCIRSADVRGFNIIQPHCPDGRLEALCHLRIIISEVTGETTEFKLHAVGIFKIDGLGPVVIYYFRHLYPFGQEFLAFFFQGGFGTRLKCEVVKGRRYA